MQDTVVKWEESQAFQPFGRTWILVPIGTEFCRCKNNIRCLNDCLDVVEWVCGELLLVFLY